MPVFEMVRMFEDLLISYLYRQKLSSLPNEENPLAKIQNLLVFG